MKVPMHYVNDAEGNLEAVQIPVVEWEKLMATMKRYEQLLKVRSDLSEALEQVKRMRAGKLRKRSLISALGGA